MLQVALLGVLTYLLCKEESRVKEIPGTMTLSLHLFITFNLQAWVSSNTTKLVLLSVANSPTGEVLCGVRE